MISGNSHLINARLDEASFESENYCTSGTSSMVLHCLHRYRLQGQEIFASLYTEYEPGEEMIFLLPSLTKMWGHFLTSLFEFIGVKM